MRTIRFILLGFYFLLATLPLAWMGLTALKTRDDAIARQVKFIPAAAAPADPDARAFAVTSQGFASLGQTSPLTGRSFYHYLLNSVVIGLLSTVASVALATSCAYGFSRFRVAGSRDWLFFILSTRFLPPLAVVVPILLMYRQLELTNTHLGLILLYTAFNLSLAVWLMKGFIDEIPRAFEEAALVDGYSRFSAFVRITLPMATTGMAVTGVFCLISAWNEYAFALSLNQSSEVAKTVPVYFASLQGNTRGINWPQVAAGSLLFVVPIVVFTVLVRKHLLRGMTFGTVKQ
jgi:multiple sugar transport system permease protein